MLLLDFIIIFCEGLRPKPPASGIALLYSDKVDFISAKKVDFKENSSSDFSSHVIMFVQTNQFCVEQPREDYIYQTPGSVLGTFDVVISEKKDFLVGMIYLIQN